jgi:hypothetical protein
MRVDVRGTVYESVKDVVGALGVKKQAVYKAIARGTTDNLGLTPPNASKPQEIGGMTFPSIAHLARYIGKDVSHTRRALQSGGRAVKNLEARVLARKQQST